MVKVVKGVGGVKSFPEDKILRAKYVFMDKKRSNKNLKVAFGNNEHRKNGNRRLDFIKFLHIRVHLCSLCPLAPVDRYGYLCKQCRS